MLFFFVIRNCHDLISCIHTYSNTSWDFPNTAVDQTMFVKIKDYRFLSLGRLIVKKHLLWAPWIIIHYVQITHMITVEILCTGTNVSTERQAKTLAKVLAKKQYTTNFPEISILGSIKIICKIFCWRLVVCRTSRIFWSKFWHCPSLVSYPKIYVQRADLWNLDLELQHCLSFWLSHDRGHKRSIHLFGVT